VFLPWPPLLDDMADDDDRVPTDRESPVGEPVVRGDDTIAGDDDEPAVAFDPDDPESVTTAVETVAAFAAGDLPDTPRYVLRAAAACAALVRAEDGYTAAAERAGCPVSLVRKWARVHDLPRPIRERVAHGDIPPSAAKHVARVQADARYLLAWAVVDDDLTVREIRAAASDVADGADPAAALREQGADPGRLAVARPVDLYRRVRAHATATDSDPDDVVTAALRDYLDD
jgi:hypothetical protein